MASLVDQIDEMFGRCSSEEIEAWLLKQRERLAGEADAGLSDYVTICNELGSFYRERGRLDESLQNYETARAKSVELLGSDRTCEYALVLLNEAGTYRYQRDFDRAFANYAEAEEILLSLDMAGTFEHASLLNNKALALLDKGDELERALELAVEAAGIVSQRCPGTPDEAISFVNLASMALRARDLELAEACARQAVELYEGLGVTSGHYPAALNVRAAVALRKGDLEAALEGFERSAELTKRNFGENRDYEAALRSVAYVRGMMEGNLSAG